MNVNGIHSAAGPNAVEPIGAASSTNAAAAPNEVHDTVEISTAAKLAAKVHDIPDVRAELVAQVKQQIADGTYETPERIEAAISKLMDELMGL